MWSGIFGVNVPIGIAELLIYNLVRRYLKLSMLKLEARGFTQ